MSEKQTSDRILKIQRDYSMTHNRLVSLETNNVNDYTLSYCAPPLVKI